MLSFTPAKLGARWSCSGDAVLALIHSQKLPAFTISPPGSKRPRYRITEQAVLDYEAGRKPHTESAVIPVKKKQPRREAVIQFYK